VVLGLHFASDVWAGAALGALLGWGRSWYAHEEVARRWPVIPSREEEAPPPWQGGDGHDPDDEPDEDDDDP
jgi:hypothetical protein